MREPFYAAGHMDDAASVASVSEFFAGWNPGYAFASGELRGEAEWRSAPGSRVCWIQEGRGEVLVPEGYRTKEGDGERLPPDYRPEPPLPGWVEAVRYAATRVDAFDGELRNAIAGICSRLSGTTYIGDAANHLWAWIEYDGVAPDPKFEAFMHLFERVYDQVGYSVKTRSGWEPVQPGDQILAGAEPLRLRGDFRYWQIETPHPIRHISALRRLRYIKDTAGGCNFQFDAFRRMPMPYYARRGVTEDNPDGVNQLNSHFVNMAKETSRAHYHPRQAVGGGRPQSEIYLVADPAVYNLSTYGRAASVTLWPEVEGANANLAESIEVPLRAGSVVYIAPGTGHRGVDVFANVVVLPGYKPKNQFFFDHA
jgi:hypothetical protein